MTYQLPMKVLRGFAGAMALMISSQASAAMLQLSGPDSVEVGDSFDVVLDVFDIGAEGLATFIIDVTFDDSLLLFEGLSLGPDLLPIDDLSLGDLGGFVALGWDAFFGDVLAGPDIELATLSFTAVDVGDALFDFGLTELVNGDPLNPDFIDVTLQTTTVSVGDATAVAEPHTLALLAVGVAGLARLRRRS